MTREEAIRILEANKPVIKRESMSARKYVEAYEMAISALSENKGGWNPLASDEEGRIIGSLPEEGEEVLVTVYGQVEIDSFGCDFEYDESTGECRNEWFCENNDIEDVRAWMPLPEPYKPEKIVFDESEEEPYHGENGAIEHW